MTKLEINEQEKSVLQWGGISGIAGGILALGVMVFVAIVLPGEPSSLQEWVTRFPDIRVLRTIENIIYIMALIFQIPLFAALFMALKKTKLAPALFGSIFGIIGISSMLFSAAPHIAHYRIANLYQTLEPGALDLATISILWQAIWGMFDEMLYIGFLVVPIGFILFGIAMFKTPAIGKGFAVTSLILGFLGFAAALVQIMFPASPIGAVSFFSILLYCFIFGIKVYRISKA